MLACFEKFPIFGNVFHTAFGVSHGFVTFIKGCGVTDFYVTGWF